MLCYLIFLLVAALVLSFFSLLPFSPVSLILSSSLIVGICLVVNKVFAFIFKAPTNLESVYISALILSLIITPARSLQDYQFLFWAGILAMASKYVLAINKKHIFNPVAISLVLTTLSGLGSTSWWAGVLPMFPFILLGLLIIKKIKKWNLISYFFLTSITAAVLGAIFRGNDALVTFNTLFFNSPILFFALIMLIEPLTSPASKFKQSFYGIAVGLMVFYFTPEIALVLGNIFSYIVSPKVKLFLNLEQKIKIAPDIYDFIFSSNQKMSFLPGQYMEWTLPHNGIDSRGNRRYFTLASSPTEDNLKIGVKFYPQGSSFKKAMLNLDRKTRIVASQLAGDFVLPKDIKKKLVFIAGGIGITPFRSMIKYLLDKDEKRDIILFYADKNYQEIVYKEIFEKARKEIGIKTVYALTDVNEVPKNWQGKVGRVSDRMIAEEVPDYSDRIFYLSGPHSMVAAFEKTLQDMGIAKNKIKTDFFPGYA